MYMQYVEAKVIMATLPSTNKNIKKSLVELDMREQKNKFVCMIQRV